jgi:ABC-type sulfate/molybdate transport systems ATPase subunit
MALAGRWRDSGDAARQPFGARRPGAQGLRAWLRRLHDEVHVTTLFVTHDQEEALGADQLVVINHGVVEQWARRASFTTVQPTRSSCASSAR